MKMSEELKGLRRANYSSTGSSFNDLTVSTSFQATANSIIKAKFTW